MSDGFEPITKQRLSDDLAQQVNQLIHAQDYQPGDRLPTISEMARRFEVGPPTLREALKKLETVGVVIIKHGSGVYVGQSNDAMLISNPIFDGSLSKKLLLDLTEARLSIEVKTVALAAQHASDEDLEQMDQMLSPKRTQRPPIMAFHRKIAEASENTVLHQILEVVSSLFQREQQMILDIYSTQHDDDVEHREILKALEQRDSRLAVERMQAHLDRVREILTRWDPEENPIR